MNNMQHSEQSYGKFDLGLKSFIKSLQVAFFAMVVLIVGLLVYFFAFEGFIIVNAQENVLVLRLGKLVDVLDHTRRKERGEGEEVRDELPLKTVASSEEKSVKINMQQKQKITRKPNDEGKMRRRARGLDAEAYGPKSRDKLRTDATSVYNKGAAQSPTEAKEPQGKTEKKYS
eukprot:TRINITY_DN5886_c0_g1_i2.p1 TRINITY_DN5886_c0_g1~~TRINITY_DN5886_c0_g1_i2.p1  ORF type:complete len:173 (+),score=11.91 TRINITY_DN5886_c0_g1_i2:438-956(+)